MTQTIDIGRPEVVVTVGYGDLISNLDVLHSHDFHPVLSTWNQAPVCLTVMISKTCWAQEDGSTLLTTGDNDAEVTVSRIKISGLFRRERDESAGQISNRIALSDPSSGSHSGLVGYYCVAICGRDFPGTVGLIHGDVFP